MLPGVEYSYAFLDENSVFYIFFRHDGKPRSQIGHCFRGLLRLV